MDSASAAKCRQRHHPHAAAPVINYAARVYRCRLISTTLSQCARIGSILAQHITDPRRVKIFALAFLWRSSGIPGSSAPAWSEQHHAFLRLLNNKGCKEESMTKGGLDALGASTTLASNKSLSS
jgi:hypothetical protein